MDIGDLRTNRRKYITNLTALLGSVSLQENVLTDNQEVEHEETPDELTLENEHVRVEFEKATGGIRQVTAKDTDTDLRAVEEQNQPPGAWFLSFYSADHEWVAAPSWAAGRPSTEVTEGPDETTVALSWENPSVFTRGHDGQYTTFSATVRLRASLRAGERFVRWNLDVDSRDDDLATKRLRYPFITSIRSIGSTGDPALVVPNRTGRRIRNPTIAERSYSTEYPSGFGTMQFLAYTHQDGGFYFDARDTEGFMKALRWRQFRDGKSLYHEFVTPEMTNREITTPYDVTLGSHEGDWYDAADRYRDWLTDNGMLPDEPMVIPEWYKQMGATIRATSYRRAEQGSEGREHSLSFEQTVDGVLDARSGLDSAIQLIWWGYQKYGMFGFGDWFPPEEGWDSFRSQIARLEAQDVAPVGFVNIRKLYEDSDVWRERSSTARNWVVRNRDQSLASHEQQNITAFHPHVVSEGWRELYADALETWVEEGAKQLWIDGIPWGGQKECYATDHFHPPGTGGKWWANELKATLQSLRSNRLESDEGVLFSGEGICDIFLPELDIQHTRDVMIETRPQYSGEYDIIPLTQYALGEHLLLRGANAYPIKTYDHSQSPLYQRLTMARSLAWGALPQVRVEVRSQNELYDEQLLTYLSRIATAFNRDAQRFLTTGRMLQEPYLESPTVEVTARTGHLADGEARTFATPAVHVSAWESENGHEQGILLTNISDQSVAPTIRLDGHSFQLNQTRFCYVVRNGTYSRLSETTDSDSMSIELAQDDVVLLVSAPQSEQREAAIESLIEAQQGSSDESQQAEDVKRAFVSGDFEAAISRATDPGQTDTPTAEPESNPASSTDQPSETASASGPGFGLPSALAGLGGSAYLLKNRLGEENDEE